jgi:hypothetical protein
MDVPTKCSLVTRLPCNNNNYKNFNPCAGNVILLLYVRKHAKSKSSLLRKGFPRCAYCQLCLIECDKVHILKAKLCF